MQDRIKLLREVLGLSQSAFGNQINLKRNTISVIESGLRNVTDRVVFDICREFNVSEFWLRTGEGEMFNQVKNDLYSLFGEYADDLTEIEISLVKTVLRLSDESRVVFDKFLNDYIEEHTKTIKDL